MIGELTVPPCAAEYRHLSSDFGSNADILMTSDTGCRTQGFAIARRQRSHVSEGKVRGRCHHSTTPGHLSSRWAAICHHSGGSSVSSGRMRGARSAEGLCVGQKGRPEPSKGGRRILARFCTVAVPAWS